MLHIPTTLDSAIEHYLQQLAQLADTVTDHTVCDSQIFQQLCQVTQAVLQACTRFEHQSTAEMIAAARALFQERTQPWFAQSMYMHRARRWPHGYPGDFATLEGIYQGAPQAAQGIGLYLDTYFLSRRIVVAARYRRQWLRERLAQELAVRRPGTIILNLGCGSCRELFELAWELATTRPQVTCIDSDPAALAYAQNLLSCGGVPRGLVSFVPYNVLRFVQPERAMKRFGCQDIIYSMGLFDYLADEPLTSILRTLYTLLAAGSALIAPFKDMQQYDVADCHWLVNWSGFLQRTEEQIDRLFAQADIPEEAITIERDTTGTMIFYTVAR